MVGSLVGQLTSHKNWLTIVFYTFLLLVKSLGIDCINSGFLMCFLWYSGGIGPSQDGLGLGRLRHICNLPYLSISRIEVMHDRTLSLRFKIISP